MPKIYYVGLGLVDADDVVRGRVILDPKSLACALNSHMRFSGQTTIGYSVLEHSIQTAVLAGTIVEHKAASGELYKEYGFTVADHLQLKLEAYLWGLLHDATEAVMCDVPSPIKKTDAFQQYRDVEQSLARWYQSHYIPSLFDREEPEFCHIRRVAVEETVHIADCVRLALEAAFLLPSDAAENVIGSLDKTARAYFDAQVLAGFKMGDCGNPVKKFPENALLFFQRIIPEVQANLNHEIDSKRKEKKA